MGNVPIVGVFLLISLVQFPSLCSCKSYIASDDTPPVNPNIYQPGLLQFMNCVKTYGIPSNAVNNPLPGSSFQVDISHCTNLPFKVQVDWVQHIDNIFDIPSCEYYPPVKLAWDTIADELTDRINKGYLYHYFVIPDKICAQLNPKWKCCKYFSIWFGPDFEKVKAPCVAIADIGSRVSFTTKAKVIGGTNYITYSWTKPGYGLTKFRDQDVIAPQTAAIVNYHVLKLKQPDYVSMSYSGYSGRFAWYTNDPGIAGIGSISPNPAPSTVEYPGFTGCDWSKAEL